MGFDPGSPGSRPGPKAGAKPLRHPGIPCFKQVLRTKCFQVTCLSLNKINFETIGYEINKVKFLPCFLLLSNSIFVVCGEVTELLYLLKVVPLQPIGF